MTKTGAHPKTQPIQALLSENATLTPLLARVKVISQLQKIYIDVAPPGVISSSRVTNIEKNDVQTTVIISAANGAIATRIKQLSPQLLLQFQKNKKQEQEVTGIRVEVQPDLNAFAAPPAPAAPRHPLSTEGLNSLLDKLSDSPLKEALREIKKRRERKR